MLAVLGGFELEWPERAAPFGAWWAREGGSGRGREVEQWCLLAGTPDVEVAEAPAVALRAMLRRAVREARDAGGGDAAGVLGGPGHQPGLARVARRRCAGSSAGVELPPLLLVSTGRRERAMAGRRDRLTPGASSFEVLIPWSRMRGGAMDRRAAARAALVLDGFKVRALAFKTDQGDRTRRGRWSADATPLRRFVVDIAGWGAEAVGLRVALEVALEGGQAPLGSGMAAWSGWDGMAAVIDLRLVPVVAPPQPVADAARVPFASWVAEASLPFGPAGPGEVVGPLGVGVELAASPREGAAPATEGWLVRQLGFHWEAVGVSCRCEVDHALGAPAEARFTARTVLFAPG